MGEVNWRVNFGGEHWEHGEDKMENIYWWFKQHSSYCKIYGWMVQLCYKFLRCWSIIESDFYLESKGSHQYLSPSCHPFLCKKRIQYSQELRLNQFCPTNDNFDLINLERFVWTGAITLN